MCAAATWPRVHSLRRGAAEALELVAHGDAKTSKVVGRRIEELDLPKGATHRRHRARDADAEVVHEDGCRSTRSCTR